ncbi:MAG TPA: exonuclease SbcCD subunit D C-terminal domain-containing protein [Actinomycetales bacterium]|jgi:exonuclease SbcD
MRILHTSDWHLGRSFHRVGMLEHQARFVDHLVDAVRSEAVDAVVVAGDVYDRALPSVDTVALLSDALARLRGAGAQVLLTSGNHDSARRLGFAAEVLELGGVHLRTTVDDLHRPVELADEHGPVAVYGLPYLEPAMCADALGASSRTHEAVLTAAMNRVRADLAARPAVTRSVVAAHAFVVGGRPSESERDISVGGVGSVPAAVLDGVDYVALGHLHGRQRLSESVRYSGSPLAYSFSEAAHVKASWLVDLGKDGVTGVTALDAPVPRRLAVLRGEIEALLGDTALLHAEDSWCQVVLTDAVRPRGAMERLQRRFPHTLSLAFDPVGAAGAAQDYASRVRGRSDMDVCCGFVEHVRGVGPDDAEVALLGQALEQSRLAAQDGDAA